MEVTRKNFNEALPLVEKSIKEADFLAIDTEFTGIINGRDVSMFDTPEEYYLRLLVGCSDFLLIQFGLCAFRWDEDKRQYMNEAYNFYLFPRGRPGPERMFLCQSSSIDFLASQGFDFNKLIRDGISYMTKPAETRVREQITERQKHYAVEKNIISISEENRPQIEDICQKVRTFINENKEESMQIDRCNSFIRRLLFQELGIRFKDEVFLESKSLENKNRVLVVTRLKSKSDGMDRDSRKKSKEWEEFDEAVGFSKVAWMISQSNKLVVGHNMVLDLMHTLNHFFQPLPPEYPNFKEFAHCMFPRLLDTKYMTSLHPFRERMYSTVLAHLYSSLCEAPFGMPNVGSEEKRGYTQAIDKQHEAGFDAYLTGLCFLSMYTHLKRMRRETGFRVHPDAVVLKPFLNKIFLSKTAPQDSPYINLVGPDPTPSRHHVFYFTFPSEWERDDINQFFSPIGPVTVQFLDETSAIVAMAQKDQERDVRRVLGGNLKITLVPFTEYMANNRDRNNKRWRRPDTETTTRRSASPSTSKTPDTNHSRSELPEKVDRTTITNSNTASSSTTPSVSSYVPELVERPPAVNTTASTSPAPSVSSYVPELVERPPGVNGTSPEKGKRRRCVSLTGTGNRKRTSSGVFTIDNAEPPAKKPEISRTPKEDIRTPSENTRTLPDAAQQSSAPVVSSRERDIADSVIKTFDSGSSKKIVSAFEENDSWE